MKAISRSEAPVAVEGDGVEVRTQKLGGGMTTAFVRLPKGADLRPAVVGLPDDLCPCPHWGYLLSGRVKMYTRNGDEVYEAGQSFYWSPGHAPEALEDSEYVDFSPSDEFDHVIAHLTRQGEAESARRPKLEKETLSDLDPKDKGESVQGGFRSYGCQL